MCQCLSVSLSGGLKGGAEKDKPFPQPGWRILLVRRESCSSMPTLYMAPGPASRYSTAHNRAKFHVILLVASNVALHCGICWKSAGMDVISSRI